MQSDSADTVRNDANLPSNGTAAVLGPPTAPPSEVAVSSNGGDEKKTLGENGAAEQEKNGTTPLVRSHPRDDLPAWKWKAMLLGNGLCAAISGYDVSNVANIQIPIYEAFGHIELLPWISLSFSLANVATVPLARKLTGFCELKTLMIGSCIFVAAGSALSGAAQNIESVIVGRALMAIGCAIVYQTGMTYNVIFAHPHELGLAQALLGAFFAIGLFTGPIIGGAFAENQSATWRWAFFLILPLTAIIIPVFIFAFPSYQVPTNKSFLGNLKQVDWVGCILHMGAFLLLGFGCIFAGPTWAWNSGSTIAVFVLLGLVLIAYAVQQTFSLFTKPEDRILPIGALGNRTVVLMSLCLTCVSASYGITLYYMPLYFAFTRNASPLAAAVRLLPFIGPFIGMLFLSGGLLPRVRYYMVFFLSGGILLLLGGGLLQTVTVTTSESNVLGFEALIGMGVGLVWALPVPVATRLLPPKQGLDAAVLANLSQLGGIAIALSIAGAVYQNEGFAMVKAVVDEAGISYAEESVRELLTGVDSTILKIAAKESPELLMKALEAVTSTLLRCYLVIIGAGAICFVSACFLKFQALDFGQVKAAKKDDPEAATQIETASST